MALINIFKTKVLRKRALFTLFVLVLYQILASVPLPGLSAKSLSNPILQLLNVTSGGGYSNLSLFALGMTPYVTASIIVQMMSSGLVKKFTRYSQEGNSGRKKIDFYTKLFTVLIAIVQAPILVMLYQKLKGFGLVETPTLKTYVFAGLIVTAGAMVAMFMGDQLNKYGLGNGPSLIIAGNIMAQMPTMCQTIYTQLTGKATATLGWLSVGTIIVGLIVLIWMYYVEKHLPLQHMREITRTSSAGYLPIKLNTSGMIPVIFVSGIVSVASMMSSLGGTFKTIFSVFNLTTTSGLVIYATLTLLFSIGYSIVQMDPKKLSKHLRQSGTYIIGVELDVTENYLTKQILTVGAYGSIVLVLIAITPYVLKIQNTVSLISLLIVVGTLMETIKQIMGVSKKYKYDTEL